jgi:hypothetical protein
MTLISYGPPGSAPTIATLDSGTFSGQLARGRQLAVQVQFSSGRVPMLVAADSAAPSSRGQRQRSSTGGQSVRSSATGGAPVSVTEYLVNGQLRSRASTTWRRVPGGWVATERAVTTFSDGRPVQTVHVALTVRSIPTPAGLPPLPLTASTTSADWLGIDLDDDEAPWEEFSPMCEKEFDSMYAALDEYFFSVAGVVGCLAGPFPCLATTINLLRAARKLDRAEEILNRCLSRPSIE